MSAPLTSAPKLLPAVSVALQDGDRLLLVRRGRAPSLGCYAFPGGRVEAGETLEEAARRELAEETGLTVGPLSPLVRVVVEGTETDYDLQVFFGRYAGGEPVAADDAAEAAFFTLAEMEALPILESVLEVGSGLLGK
ncbi:MAG: NUDIX domain-containing protein [Pseudomonadota bacterium]|nr:NUDIX domain-containing protein [Pseudomonadota bacterium]